MDWWLIPVGIAVLVTLRLLWVAAFHSGETVSAVPELDGYVPRGRGGGSPDEPVHEAPSTGTSPGAASSTDSDESTHAESTHAEPDPSVAGPRAGATPPGRPGSVPEAEVADEDGIWIELDIEPLFSSSDSSVRDLVDITEEQDSEPRSS